VEAVNLALFLHVLGAMLLVGGLLAGASLLAAARGDAGLLRLGYWTLVAVGVPSYALVWGAGHWAYTEAGLDESPIDAAWTTIGFLVVEVGALLMLTALVLGGVGVYRLRDGKGRGLLRAAMVLSLVLLAAVVVAAWAMSAKPE
jgi:ABC-type sugar transport system permease subunit